MYEGAAWNFEWKAALQPCEVCQRLFIQVGLLCLMNRPDYIEDYLFKLSSNAQQIKTIIIPLFKLKGWHISNRAMQTGFVKLTDPF